MMTDMTNAVVGGIAEVRQAIENGEMDPVVGEGLLQKLDVDLHIAKEGDVLIQDVIKWIAHVRQACADDNISKGAAVSLIRSLKDKFVEIQSEHQWIIAITPYSSE